MNRFILKIYDVLPLGLKHKLGESKSLRWLRRKLLYTDTGFKTIEVLINHTYANFKTNFNFVASLKMASKAKKIGIENTILKNNFKLLKKYKPNREDLIVLDVGANFGFLGAVWADTISKNGKTLAFEPNKNLFSVIEQTISANLKFQSNFKVFNLAVGNTNGIIKLNVSAFSSNTNTMESAIEFYDINMIRLDDFVNEQGISVVDVLKIDVDGIELEILKGSENILKQQSTIVIVETNNNKDIVDYFKRLNYCIYDMQLNKYEYTSVLPLNIFCVPKSLMINAI